MKKIPNIPSCHYDYANKCDCSEDDKCGCDYPNNMSHNFTSSCFTLKTNKIFPNQEDCCKDEEILFHNPICNKQISSISNSKTTQLSQTTDN